VRKETKIVDVNEQVEGEELTQDWRYLMKIMKTSEPTQQELKAWLMAIRNPTLMNTSQTKGEIKRNNLSSGLSEKFEKKPGKHLSKKQQIRILKEYSGGHYKVRELWDKFSISQGTLYGIKLMSK